MFVRKKLLENYKKLKICTKLIFFARKANFTMNRYRLSRNNCLLPIKITNGSFFFLFTISCFRLELRSLIVLARISITFYHSPRTCIDALIEKYRDIDK